MKVWTRFFPLSIKIREMVKDGTIGKVNRVIADLSINAAHENGNLDFADDHRMVNLDLAGGALLDLGIYSLTWCHQILYLCQPEPRERPTVVASMQKYDKTGSDETTSIILSFPKNGSTGIALTSLRVGSDVDGKGSAGSTIRIQGTKGEIQVLGMAYSPTGYRVIKTGDNSNVEEVSCPKPLDKDREDWGFGMYWEADEVARCLRDGKKESETLTWKESVIIMEIMDEARKQGGLVYSELIETAVYDEKSSLNGK
jgi:predicted dehydrogenase